jgi:hypothetical protein
MMAHSNISNLEIIDMDRCTGWTDSWIGIGIDGHCKRFYSILGGRQGQGGWQIGQKD